MTQEGVSVRNARLGDAAAIAALTKEYAGEGIMLERPVDNIIENIRNFFVAEHAGRVIGCCAVAFYTPKLAEIRSLAVEGGWKLRGTGRQLVEKAESILRDEGVAEVFVLTLSREFFLRLGYGEVEKEYFPQKIWRDCTRCPKLMACDEIAMKKTLVPTNIQT
ncbi:N-acetyltransferase [Chlorobium sp. N1]|uniref:N-acetyltransferase n=1 Tax=Chlorobium sp. N1 TaxID=2491138 RepID=UPI0010395092|nr:N-acetyltransferase [Chlorobium sp. N1]TCD47748.1 N-acetyltransferase [Chlorobium sp. N1]